MIVADASRDLSASIVRLSFPNIHLVTLPQGALAPDLWAKGFAVAKGRAVAFTTAHCVVPESWVSDLSRALENGSAGAGGPISLDEESSLLDAAIYFLRFSSFLPGSFISPQETREIAGDNSMYSRSVLDENSSSFANGFWEVELHDNLRSQGKRLSMVPSATVSFGRSFPLAVISRQRFAHGKHFGRWRRSTGTSALRIILVSPVVPAVMLARALRRVVSARASVGRLIMCSPIYLWLAACWAFGEAVGASQQTSERNANRR